MTLPSRFLKELPESDIEFEDKNMNAGYGFNVNSNFGGYTKTYSNSSFSKPSNFGSNFAANSSQATKQTSEKSENSVLYKRVFHQKFGYGKVVSIDGNKLEIQFEKTGTKTVMKEFVTLA